MTTTASTRCKGQGARCKGQDQHQCKSERDAATTCNSNHNQLRSSTGAGGVHDAAIIATCVRVRNSNSFHTLSFYCEHHGQCWKTPNYVRHTKNRRENDFLHCPYLHRWLQPSTSVPLVTSRQTAKSPVLMMSQILKWQILVTENKFVIVQPLLATKSTTNPFYQQYTTFFCNIKFHVSGPLNEWFEGEDNDSGYRAELSCHRDCTNNYISVYVTTKVQWGHYEGATWSSQTVTTVQATVSSKVVFIFVNSTSVFFNYYMHEHNIMLYT